MTEALNQFRPLLPAPPSEAPAQGLQPARALTTASSTDGGYDAVIPRVREALRASDIRHAESLLMRAGDLGQHDPCYFNLIGVVYEMRRQWSLAKKFYGKAIRADRKYEPAQQNMRRIYELFIFGRSKEPVALGDEPPCTGALAELLRQAAQDKRRK